MGRKRIHTTAAERQKSYRARVSNQASTPHPAVPRKPKKVSRPARLVALETGIRTLLEEYEDWLSQIPETLEATAQVALLTEAIEKLTDAAELLAEITPPRGFGRD